MQNTFSYLARHILRLCQIGALAGALASVLSGALFGIAYASESDLDDPLESLEHKSDSGNSSNAGALDSGDSGNSSTLDSGAQNIARESSTKESATKDSSTRESSTQDLPSALESRANAPATSAKDSQNIVEKWGERDFAEIQKDFPWIKSVGLAMVSFDDGSFRSGFGVLLPENIFLTSAELAHNASTYPKNILLKMRDVSAGNLICVAQLRLKALDKVRGLALLEISGYTDDYCNLRSQSYYHKQIMQNNAYDITKYKGVKTSDFYTVTTSFNAPNISVLRFEDAKNNATNDRASSDYAQGDHALPIKNDQKIVFGRPFFSKSGELLGMATMPNDAFRPIIISRQKIQGFLCELDKNGFQVSDFTTKICR
ncbi:hypothetical protein BKN38_07395 [Helicobacter sp. CLO-3]|uniref:hypothetical protein n=1 Tax=unclassified Helicobacter TaxID=2593540 RepID=UPI0008055C36|nr:MULTISPECIES: hypothetical protein [unclassified Helicobacter]OBV29059.1 hypothetical protein BA723_07035 [Helicobacter sp. CLO-3]OHU82254.1 hypothetical protein BKN38_07395 [Helicobacter sp. CLO-3]